MYSLKEVVNMILDNNDLEAACVHGQLKGFILNYCDGGFNAEEPDGTGYGIKINSSVFAEYVDTEWIIIEN
jgi:hypothetical protein